MDDSYSALKPSYNAPKPLIMLPVAYVPMEHLSLLMMLPVVHHHMERLSLNLHTIVQFIMHLSHLTILLVLSLMVLLNLLTILNLTSTGMIIKIKISFS